MSSVVALAYDANLAHANGIYQGVAEYVRENELDWQVVPLNYAFESNLVELAESGRLRGAIGNFVSDGWARCLTDQGVRAVNLFQLSQIKTLPCAGVDDQAMGRAAADHLREQGARALAYFAKGQNYQNQLREAGLKNSGSAAEIVHFEPAQTLEARIETLSQLPRPVGVYCASDRLARELIAGLRERGLEAGRDALILGTGDESVEGLFAGLEISSFRLPTVQVGIAAARLLDKQLNDRGGATEVVKSHLLPAQLMARASSLPTPRGRLANRAAQLAETRLADPDLDIAAMMKILGTSRRSLELALRSEYGQSPYQMLSRLRYNRACSLLLDSQLSVAEVGLRCGYPEPHHFSAWFKQRGGFSPSSYRKQSHAQRNREGLSR